MFVAALSRKANDHIKALIGGVIVVVTAVMVVVVVVVMATTEGDKVMNIT